VTRRELRNAAPAHSLDRSLLVRVPHRHFDDLAVRELEHVGRAQVEREPALLAGRQPVGDGHDEVTGVDELADLCAELVIAYSTTPAASRAASRSL